MNASLICSGGFDSVPLACRLAAEQSLGTLLTSNHRQHHRKEIDAARQCAERRAVPHGLETVALASLPHPTTPCNDQKHWQQAMARISPCTP